MGMVPMTVTAMKITSTRQSQVTHTRIRVAFAT